MTLNRNLSQRFIPNLETLYGKSPAITGKDLIKRREEKDDELALFQRALEFEKLHLKS